MLSRFLRDAGRSKTLVFSRTKRGADKIARVLERDGIRAIAVHGNKSQARRQAAMREFNAARPPVLVATDLAARGLDFSDVRQVINYDLPDVPETYVHRIGRTARAGAAGNALSFCSGDEKHLLRMIEKLTGARVPVAQLDRSQNRSQKDPSNCLPKPARSSRRTRESVARAEASENTEVTDAETQPAVNRQVPRHARGQTNRTGKKTRTRSRGKSSSRRAHRNSRAGNGSKVSGQAER